MKNPFTKYTRFIKPNLSQLDLEEQKNANLVVFLIALTQTILLIFFPVNIFSGKTYAPINNIVAIGLLGINAAYFKKTANFKNAFFFYVLIILTLVSTEHLISPEHMSGNVLWLPVLLFVSCYLLDTPRMIATFIYGNLLFVLAYTLPLYFDTPLDNAPPKDANFINIASVFLSSIAIVFVARNFSQEEKLVKEKLKKGKKLFKQISEKNVALLGILSHDISNPLMSATWRAEFLKKDPKKENVDLLLEQLSHISAITEDVRKYAALGTGKIKLEPASVDLSEITSKAIEDQQEIIARKNIMIDFNAPKPDHYMVLAEPHSLRTTVLGNIISNAVKFSYPNSKIAISLKQGKKTFLTIQDFGKGISPNRIPSLFRFDFPTSSPGTQGEKGTGLGLPLVKMILDTYGAEIKIESSDKEPNRGTSIILGFLPVTQEKPS